MPCTRSAILYRTVRTDTTLAINGNYLFLLKLHLGLLLTVLFERIIYSRPIHETCLCLIMCDHFFDIQGSHILIARLWIKDSLRYEILGIYLVYGDLHEVHRLIHDDTAHIDLVQAYLRAAEVVTSIGVYGAFIDRGLSLFSMALM